MCGIAGIISAPGRLVAAETLRVMADSIKHRGPDGEGFWISPEGNVGFGHRRLSIIDLSPEAAQPMHYLGRYSIVYNGEIYNYKELKKDLVKSGYNFKTQSDTEVILAAFDCYQSRCLQYFDGMFAFAIWDNKNRRLFAAKDRFGEKPFYYHFEENTFSFASEMKGLWAAGAPRKMSNKMMLNYLALSQVQYPTDKSETFYQDIFSLPPAHYLEYEEAGELTIYSYYDIDKQLSQRYRVNDALERLDSLLSESVQRRLRSDVETGSSLSGGIDSSAIAWYIRNHKREHKTFSAVFEGFERDESENIAKLREHLSLTNFTVTPNAQDLYNEISRVAWHQEEPFPSSSIFAQFKVFELAASGGIKVLLDGQGADEIFAGYEKYYHWYLQDLVGHHQFLRARREYVAFRRNNANLKWNFRNIIAAFLPSHTAMALEKRELGIIRSNNFINPELMSALKGHEWEGLYKPTVTKLNDILYFNTMQLGMEELLRYSDRNAMAHGVEIRLPFLNSDLVRFAFSLPASFKIRNGYSKWILRTLMSDRLPESIAWQKRKTGFEPPQKAWLQSSAMKELIHTSKQKLVENRILRPAVMEKEIIASDAHAAGNRDWRFLCLAQLI